MKISEINLETALDITGLSEVNYITTMTDTYCKYSCGCKVVRRHPKEVFWSTDQNIYLCKYHSGFEAGYKTSDANVEKERSLLAEVIERQAETERVETLLSDYEVKLIDYNVELDRINKWFWVSVYDEAIKLAEMKKP